MYFYLLNMFQIAQKKFVRNLFVPMVLKESVSTKTVAAAVSSPSKTPAQTH